MHSACQFKKLLFAPTDENMHVRNANTCKRMVQGSYNKNTIGKHSWACNILLGGLKKSRQRDLSSYKVAKAL